MSPEQPPRLTPKLLDLVARDRQSRPPVGRLTPAQVEALSAVAKRQPPYDVTVDSSRAIAALAEGGSTAKALPVIQDVLADASAPQPDQVAAARALGSVATPGAERVILGQLDKSEPRVQQELLAALGTFGSPAAAAPLSELTTVDDPDLRRQLAFARALIAHRHDLEGPFLAPEAPAKRRQLTKGVDISFSVKPARAVTADRTKLTGSTFGIGLAPRALGMKCGPADWTVFLNESLGPTPKDLAPAFERPWIAGVAAQRYPGREGLATRMVILTRPEGSGIRIELARADGEMMYVGSAKRSDAGIAFTISDVERPASASTRLTGVLTARGVELESSAVSATRRGVRTTEDVAAHG
jgi:hypothetical protein